MIIIYRSQKEKDRSDRTTMHQADLIAAGNGQGCYFIKSRYPISKSIVSERELYDIISTTLKKSPVGSF